MDLQKYRASPSERQRTEDLLSLMPLRGRSALDIGARDGYFSMLLVDRFEEVTALDLVRPEICHPRINCVKGDAQELGYSDGSFDFVFCAEVLEHIPMPVLARVCREIERVAGQAILVGVPYKQDIRVGRTTCVSCGGLNPPWGHVSTFDVERLKGLFPSCRVVKTSMVGLNKSRTNSVAARLLDFAGNPYGTYGQEEPCIHCGARILRPPDRSIVQRVATKSATILQNMTEAFYNPRANWVHIVFEKLN